MKTQQAARLFDGWDEALIWSCLQGHMGHVEADCATNPTSAMAETGDFCFFAGRPNAVFFEFLQGSKLLIPQNEGWEALIEAHYGARIEKTLRYAIKKEPDVFDRKKLTAYVDALGQEYQIRLFDQALFAAARAEEWSFDLCSQFRDAADYVKRALGVAVLHEGTLVAGASPYAVYDGGIEIEIDTKPEYRQKGLATVCGAKLILECLNRNLYPSWDAHDLRSVALAEKLGYHLDKPYVTYVLGEKE